MVLVKGENGVVFAAVDSIASGLVGGGHAVYVDATGKEVAEPVAADEQTADVPAGKGAKG